MTLLNMFMALMRLNIKRCEQNFGNLFYSLMKVDPEIDRVGLNDRSEFNSGRLDRSTRLLTGLTIYSTSLNVDRLNRLTRLQLVSAMLKQRRLDAR
jgi:hypothetical protein